MKNKITKKYLKERIEVCLDGYKLDMISLDRLRESISETQEYEELDDFIISEALTQMECAYYLIKEFKKYLKQKSKK